jgi:hypothetical protein
MKVGSQRHATPLPIYPRETDLVPILLEVGWASRTVWTGAENLAPAGIRSSDLPARSESLYRLSYPGPYLVRGKVNGKAIPLQALTGPEGFRRLRLPDF